MQNKIDARAGYFSVQVCSSVLLQETDLLHNMGKKVFY